MPSSGELFERLVAIMAQLRAPGGCPWDRKQTFDSIKPYTVEETYEVLQAITDRDWAELAGELGDLLLQILFYAQMAQEERLFSIEDVLRQLAEKLIRRHPHVFADDSGQKMSADEALGRWDQVKAEEKRTQGRPPAASDSLLSTVPRSTPAMVEAFQLSRRAATAGFEWPGVQQVLEKLEEEIAELRAELHAGNDRKRLEEEAGDLLFTAVNVARRLEIEPESALKSANRKFRGRFSRVEALLAEQNTSLDAQSPERLEQLWQAAKKGE